MAHDNFWCVFYCTKSHRATPNVYLYATYFIIAVCKHCLCHHCYLVGLYKHTHADYSHQSAMLHWTSPATAIVVACLNAVALQRSRLVQGWVKFMSSSHVHTILVFNQPPQHGNPAVAGKMSTSGVVPTQLGKKWWVLQTLCLRLPVY